MQDLTLTLTMNHRYLYSILVLEARICRAILLCTRLGNQLRRVTLRKRKLVPFIFLKALGFRRPPPLAIHPHIHLSHPYAHLPTHYTSMHCSSTQLRTHHVHPSHRPTHLPTRPCMHPVGPSVFIIIHLFYFVLFVLFVCLAFLFFFFLYRLNEAVRSVFLHLTGPMAWARERVVVIGRSLGSGPATYLAREFQPGVRIRVTTQVSLEVLKYNVNN